MELVIPRGADFEVTGLGDAPAWTDVAWQPLVRVGEGQATYATRAKVAYSETGIYFLVDCEDRQLTCTMTAMGDNIFQEDVVEVFLWPHEPQIAYFEYEISPLSTELPILVVNSGGRFHGWLPWHYEGNRQTRKATNVRGGEMASMAAVDGWTTEFFLPFALLAGLDNVPPRPGTRWRANIYRIDYDALPSSQWTWDPATGGNFHDYANFGAFIFG